MSSLTFDQFVTARAGLRRNLSQTRAERLGRPIKGQEFDDHGMLVQVDDPPAPPMAFHLIYSDAKNSLSGVEGSSSELKSLNSFTIFPLSINIIEDIPISVRASLLRVSAA